MMGTLWGYKERSSDDEFFPTNVMGSLGSLGIEWGYKVRPEKDNTSDIDEESSCSFDKFDGEEIQEEEHTEILEIPQERRETEEGSNLPRLSDFFIDDVRTNLVQFRESLDIMLQGETKPVGKYNITIEPMGENNKDFRIHMSGRSVIRGVRCSTTVTTCVNNHLMTIEEKLHEDISELSNECKEEIHLYIAQDETNSDGHYVHISSIQKLNDYEDKRAQDVPYDTVKNLLSEGACLLLMRMMAIVKFNGTIDLQGVLTNSALYRTTLTCEGPEEQYVNGKKMPVFVINRKGVDASGKELLIRSTLTKAGQLVEHNWLNGPVFMQVSKLAHVRGSTTQNIERQIPLHHHWEDDMQATSVYLDSKNRKFTMNKAYFLDHPEIKNLIADYVQAVLLLKPENIIQFSIEHFQAFGEKEEPKNIVQPSV